MINVRWQPGDPFPLIRAEAWAGLQRAVAFLHAKLLEELNTPNTGTRVKYRKGGKRRSRTVYRDPSRPGEPPRKRTGWLQRNVLYELDKAALRARVGVSSSAIYGMFLDLGTVRMQARPWLAVTVKKYAAQMRALAALRK